MINENHSVADSMPYCRNPSSETFPAAAVMQNNNISTNREKTQQQQQQQNGNAAVNVVAGISSLNLVKVYLHYYF